MDRRTMLGVTTFAAAGGTARTAFGMGRSDEATCDDGCTDCVSACLACVDACLNELISGKTGVKACIKLCLDCADICGVCSKISARKGPMAKAISITCAEACERCAEECEKHDDAACKLCAERCRACAKECRMAAA